jgi:hypothetical protein
MWVEFDCPTCRATVKALVSFGEGGTEVETAIAFCGCRIPMGELDLLADESVEKLSDEMDELLGPVGWTDETIAAFEADVAAGLYPMPGGPTLGGPVELYDPEIHPF